MRYDYTPFYEGQVDFWPLYLNAQAVIIGEKLEKAGEKYAFMSPDELGVRFVANSVVTTREMLEKRPETVQTLPLRPAPGLAGCAGPPERGRRRSKSCSMPTAKRLRPSSAGSSP